MRKESSVFDLKVYRPAQHYAQLSHWQTDGRIYYDRASNPIVEQTEDRLAALERGAAGCVLTSSGMSALLIILASLHLKRGSTIWVQDGVFAQTYELAWYWSKQIGCAVKKFDPIAEYPHKPPQVFLLQNPLSESMQLYDLEALIKKLRTTGDTETVIAVDNSFFTPLNYHPFAIGADIVWYSATKYLSGHGNIMSGAALSNDAKRIRSWKEYERLLFGCVLSPGSALELQRGLETLRVRMPRMATSAGRVWSYLADCRWVKDAQYPGGCGMLSFRCPDAEYVSNSLRRFLYTVHWGDAVSTVVYIDTEDLIRLSIGLEQPEILIDDLSQAFALNGLS
jgi:cystathionine gamma-synthase